MSIKTFYPRTFKITAVQYTLGHEQEVLAFLGEHWHYEPSAITYEQRAAARKALADAAYDGEDGA